MIRRLRGEDYLSKFDCKEYLRRYYRSSSGAAEEGGAADFHKQQVNNFYKKYSAEWDKNTARLLEFGGGPVIAGLISPAPYVREIVFAAYSAEERREVELWRDQKDGAHDWSEHLRYVVNELEGKGGDAAWQEREALIRSRMTSIIACDIKQECPLEVEKGPFTIISTSLCLEAACESYAEYKRSVQKLGQLLEPGGFLTMLAVEGESFYVVGQDKWYCLDLTQTQIEEALEEAGFAVLVTEREPAPIELTRNPTVSDYKSVSFIVARRK